MSRVKDLRAMVTSTREPGTYVDAVSACGWSVHIVYVMGVSMSN